MRVDFNVLDFLRRGSLAHPDRTAVVDEPMQPATSWGSITYAELMRRARAQAAALDALGVGPGQRVAVMSQNSARLLTAFFGVCGWGRILVPVNFRLAVEEAAYVVQHSGADVLLIDPELDRAMRSIGGRRWVMGAESDQDLYRYDVEPRPWMADEDATATINYTSGTTARPKGVQLTHRNCWVNAAMFGWHAGVAERDVYLHTLPMFHCNGWGMPFALAAMGCPQVVLRKVDGAEILGRVEQHGVTLLCGAPAVVAAALEAAGDWSGPVPGAGTARIVVAGAPPPTRIIQRVETELGWEFIQIYGLTETAPLLVLNRATKEWDGLDPGERAQRLSRAGPPVVSTELAISEEGEVLTRSNTVMDGYWSQPEATSRAMEGGWFHTGDGGLVDEENYLQILDRKKDIIITGGENVSSIEVEDIIFSMDGVQEVAVIGVPDDRWGEMVVALVVMDPETEVDEESVRQHCRAHLAGFKIPKRVEFRQELTRTATGKLQKFKLRAPYWEGRERQVN